ncbi:hypothetical protein N0M98_33135 [Paenibacillus doosanensis]|uniref:Uncharacterized protein n=1 Tax=Paenibacillus konkukensis TaxID=2020716 RepID=A0ABY4RMQ7_9BACL|nr:MULTISPECIES: hypothetical protein [Paenibacillus]MCS7464929.1 hypothetical protein [Paenibacillus doosanensis]UQZ83754.1 hypothetical protein SK3146_02961 [Paenibacillus konkukensis]
MKSCSIEGCDRPVKAKQLCSTHHQRLLRNGSPLIVRKKSKKEPKQCGWINCKQYAVSKGYCPKHYYIHKKFKQLEAEASRG